MLSGHDLDLPSCIPAEFNVTHLLEDEEAILAVFVNTSVYLEASVAMGTNLTFTFSFEDSGEILTQICETCTSVIQVSVTNLLDIFLLSISTDLIPYQPMWKLLLCRRYCNCTNFCGIFKFVNFAVCYSWQIQIHLKINMSSPSYTLWNGDTGCCRGKTLIKASSYFYIAQTLYSIYCSCKIGSGFNLKFPCT